MRAQAMAHADTATQAFTPAPAAPPTSSALQPEPAAQASMLTVMQAVMTTLSTMSANQDTMTAAVLQSLNGKATATVHDVQGAPVDHDLMATPPVAQRPPMRARPTDASTPLPDVFGDTFLQVPPGGSQQPRDAPADSSQPTRDTSMTDMSTASSVNMMTAPTHAPNKAIDLNNVNDMPPVPDVIAELAAWENDLLLHYDANVNGLGPLIRPGRCPADTQVASDRTAISRAMQVSRYACKGKDVCNAVLEDMDTFNVSPSEVYDEIVDWMTTNDANTDIIAETELEDITMKPEGTRVEQVAELQTQFRNIMKKFKSLQMKRGPGYFIMKMRLAVYRGCDELRGDGDRGTTSIAKLWVEFKTKAAELNMEERIRDKGSFAGAAGHDGDRGGRGRRGRGNGRGGRGRNNNNDRRNDADEDAFEHNCPVCGPNETHSVHQPFCKTCRRHHNPAADHFKESDRGTPEERRRRRQQAAKDSKALVADQDTAIDKAIQKASEAVAAQFTEKLDAVTAGFTAQLEEQRQQSLMASQAAVADHSQTWAVP